jgi:hypothetical protein
MCGFAEASVVNDERAPPECIRAVRTLDSEERVIDQRWVNQFAAQDTSEVIRRVFAHALAV